MLLIMSIAVSFMLVPASAFAWGPLTHIYLGSEIFSLGPLLPVGLLALIRKYRKDFLYGTLMADSIIGKKYLPEHRNSHSWDMAFELLAAAGTDQQKAFVYGYMSHLAADTVAHNKYTLDRRNLGHTVMEMKADCIIDKKHWFQAVAIDKKVQMRNDLFLENLLQSFMFSFKTNKRIFKGVVLLTLLNGERIGDFIDRNLVTSLPDRAVIEDLHEESLDRIVDLFQYWDRSDVVKENPSGRGQGRKAVKAFFLKSASESISKNNILI